MARKTVIMQELGVLLKQSDVEYAEYKNVYDKKHGYYDENKTFGLKGEFETLKAEAIEYVNDGYEGTYAIISDQGLIEDDIDVSKLEIDDFASYEPSDVLWSIAKINGIIVENFVKNQQNYRH